jgi:hypothetical protein
MITTSRKPLPEERGLFASHGLFCPKCRLLYKIDKLAYGERCVFSVQDNEHKSLIMELQRFVYGYQYWIREDPDSPQPSDDADNETECEEENLPYFESDFDDDYETPVEIDGKWESFTEAKEWLQERGFH